MIVTTVSVYAPAASANQSCDATAAALVYATVLDAAASATTVAGGVDVCSLLPLAALRRNLGEAYFDVRSALQGSCAQSTVVQAARYSVSVVVPLGSSAGAALLAINALSASSFAAAADYLAVAAGCPPASVSFGAVATTAACGTASDGSAPCDVPPGAAQSANAGAIIGGVVGGAVVFAVFVIAVLALRGACACCSACPRRPAKLGSRQ